MHHLLNEEWLPLWAVLVAIDIIREKLPLMTEVPFVPIMHWAPAAHQDCVYSSRRKIDRIWVLFLVSSVKTCSKFIWNTDNISHVPIVACPGITSSLTSHGSPNDTTQHFFLKFVSCTVIWNKNIPFQTSMENFCGEPTQRVSLFELMFPSGRRNN